MLVGSFLPSLDVGRFEQQDRLLNGALPHHTTLDLIAHGDCNLGVRNCSVHEE
jgi:hypothetical protein